MDSIQGMLGGGGSATSLNGQSMYTGLKSLGGSFLTIVFWGALLSAIGYLIYQVVIYNVNVTLRIMKDGVVQDIKKRKARIYKDKKTQIYKMKIRGIKGFQEVPLEKYRQRKGRQHYYDGILDINNKVHWIELTKPSNDSAVLLEPQPQVSKGWQYQQ